MDKYGRQPRHADEEWLLRRAEAPDEGPSDDSRRARAGRGRSASLAHLAVVLVVVVFLAISVADWWMPRSPHHEALMATADARLTATALSAPTSPAAGVSTLVGYPYP